MTISRFSLALLLFTVISNVSASDLFNKKNLDGWEVVGDGVWTVMKDGTLVGQRNPQVNAKTDPNQSWLYTKKEFGEFDLHLEWWTRLGGNSGVSLRDQTRAIHSFGAQADPKLTPSHVGYEIQISNGYKDKYPTGSLYLFEAAKTGYQVENDWNSMDIESRNNIIRVKLNGHVIMENAGDPKRSKIGPIGLQLHDMTSLVMFRNITMKEIH
jgi:3-keto-disaccharide hydrolase